MPLLLHRLLLLLGLPLLVLFALLSLFSLLLILRLLLLLLLFHLFLQPGLGELEVVLRVHIVRIELQRFRVRLDRLDELVLAKVGVADVVVYLRLELRIPCG